MYRERERERDLVKLMQDIRNPHQFGILIMIFFVSFISVVITIWLTCWYENTGNGW